MRIRVVKNCVFGILLVLSAGASAQQLPSWALPDSISVNNIPVVAGADSVQEAYKAFALEKQRRMDAKLDSGSQAINHLSDSLKSLQLSASAYGNQLMTAYSTYERNIQELVSVHGDSLCDPLKRKLSAIDSELKKKKAVVDSVMQANGLATVPFPDDLDVELPELPKLNLDVADLTVPTDLKIPQISGVNLEGLGPEFSLPELVPPEIGGLNNMKETINGLQGIPGKAGAYESYLVKLKSGELESVDKLIDQQLSNITEVEGITSKLKTVEQLQNSVGELTDKAKDREAVEEEVRERVKKKFVDYFAGHEDKIQSEIQSLEKLQKKYHSLADARYLPKRRTNPESMRPVIERIIIGTEFQIDRNDPKWTGVDVSPYFGYRFSDRFRAQLGGTYRVTVDFSTMEVNKEQKVYGYRGFANYKLIPGLFAHAEVENMYRTIPPFYANQINSNYSENPTWIPRAFVGIMKTYTINRHFSGQTQILYDFLDVAKNFQFNKVAFRFGFEYRILKKQRKASQTD